MFPAMRNAPFRTYADVVFEANVAPCIRFA